jgi:anti-sigma factor RsiW
VKHLSEDLISAWVDGQLEPGEMDQVECHLRDCGGCRATADEMSALTEAFRAAETAELPPYLWGRIAASLQKEASPRQTGFRSWVMPVFGNPLLARAAAAVLAIAILAAGGAIYIERKSAAAFKRQALAEMQLAQNSLVALDAESYNPFRTAGAAYREVNPFSRDQVRPDINPFRSAAGNR